MTAIGRRRIRNANSADATAVIADPAAEAAADAARLDAAEAARRLDEALRLNETLARRCQRFSDFTDAILANAPGWDEDAEEPAETTALRYLRHLEREVDRRGGSRKPPWAQRDAEGDEPLLEAVKAQTGLGYVLDPASAVPPRTAPEPAEAPKDPGPEASPPPVGEDGGPTAAQSSPGASGPVSTEDGEPDEPVAEADCAEGSEA